MSDAPRHQVILDYLIGIPLLVVLAIVGLVVVPPCLLFGAFRRTICPKCRIPFARRVVRETFDRENIKFHIDHYKIACQCRWCGNRWEYDRLRDPDPQRREDSVRRKSAPNSDDDPVLRRSG